MIMKEMRHRYKKYFMIMESIISGSGSGMIRLMQKGKPMAVVEMMFPQV